MPFIRCDAIIIDGTQLHSARKELDGKSLYRIHNKGTGEEYRENYYYVLEAKLLLHPKILVSIQAEFNCTVPMPQT